MEIFVLNSYKGSRIERFIIKTLGITKVFSYKLIRENKIAVFRNNQRLKTRIGLILEPKDKIVVFYKINCKNQEICDKNEKFLYKNTIWDENDFAIIYKPQGLASQSGSGISSSLDELIKPYYLVHRLDKQTEGLMIIAKTVEKARYFGNLMKKNLVKKYYLCGLDGCLKESVWVDKNLMKTKYETIIHEEGKAAKTHFIPLKHFPEKNQTLCLVTIIHGRTHQIRVHAQHLGLSIIQDNIYNPKYKDTKENSLYLCAYGLQLPCGRLFFYNNLNFPGLNISSEEVQKAIQSCFFSDNEALYNIKSS